MIGTLAYCKELEAGGSTAPRPRPRSRHSSSTCCPISSASPISIRRWSAPRTPCDVRLVGFMLGIAGLMNAVLFTLLHFLPPAPPATGQPAPPLIHVALALRDRNARPHVGCAGLRRSFPPLR